MGQSEVEMGLLSSLFNFNLRVNREAIVIERCSTKFIKQFASLKLNISY